MAVILIASLACVVISLWLAFGPASEDEDRDE